MPPWGLVTILVSNTPSIGHVAVKRPKPTNYLTRWPFSDKIGKKCKDAKLQSMSIPGVHLITKIKEKIFVNVLNV